MRIQCPSCKRFKLPDGSWVIYDPTPGTEELISHTNCGECGESRQLSVVVGDEDH